MSSRSKLPVHEELNYYVKLWEEYAQKADSAAEGMENEAASMREDAAAWREKADELRSLIASADQTS